MTLYSEQLLEQQLNQLSSLLGLIEQEKEVLQEHSPEALTHVAEQKNALLLSVQEIDEKISQSPNFAQEKASGVHQEILDKIAGLLKQCKEANTVNGLIIQQSQIAVEKMKTSLLEKSSKTSMTYDNKGKTSGGLKSLGIKA